MLWWTICENDLRYAYYTTKKKMSAYTYLHIAQHKANKKNEIVKTESDANVRVL